MSVTKQERDSDENVVETVPGHPDLSLAEYLKSVDAEAKAEIDRGWRADMAKEHSQALKEERRQFLKEEHSRALKEERRQFLKEEHSRALKEERRQFLKKELERAIDWQIMVGNHRDLANVYARSMLLQSG